MFIKQDDVVDLVIYYREVGRKDYEAFTSDEFSTDVEEKEKDKFNQLKVSMRRMNWGTYNSIQDQATEEDALTGKRNFNYIKYKESRLKAALASWDAKDAEGKEVPITEENIKSLSPDIAEAILRAYDSDSFVDEDEEKN